jgi:hypothetical protein
MKEQKPTTLKPLPSRTLFRFEPVRSPKLPFVAETTCLFCATPMRVRFGAIAATFRIGNEVVGVACDECLDDDSRDRLARFREIENEKTR